MREGCVVVANEVVRGADRLKSKQATNQVGRYASLRVTRLRQGGRAQFTAMLRMMRDRESLSAVAARQTAIAPGSLAGHRGDE